MSLFTFGDPIELSSGRKSPFKINCDHITHEDWWALADLAVCHLKPFFAVESVPTGGDYWANILAQYCQEKGGLLIVDDVGTTWASMEKQRNGREAQGVVVFARSKPPAWIRPLFRLQVDV